ncbi:MAG: hypothetical protein J0H59_05515 [Comamonadaceae bacterium]|nr:hypothetical protein [Comamonadaceae bacterium]
MSGDSGGYLNRQRLVASFDAGTTARIHAEKLGEIPRFLVQQGLAKQVDWAWYDVETGTANQFMSYIATCLGEFERWVESSRLVTAH